MNVRKDINVKMIVIAQQASIKVKKPKIAMLTTNLYFAFAGMTSNIN